MATKVFAILALFCLAPFAAAGGYDASVSYLESDGAGCDHASSSGESWSNDSGWWWYDSSTRCVDAFTYGSAEVSDDDGRIVRVRAGSDREEDVDRRSYGGWSWHSGNDSSRSHTYRYDRVDNRSSDVRVVSVDGREGSYALTHGCERRSHDTQYSGSSSGHRDGAGHEDRYGSSQAVTSEDCGLTFRARRGVTDAEVTPYASRCADSATHSDSSTTSYTPEGTKDSSFRSHQHDRRCFSGAEARVGDDNVTAGSFDECTHRGRGASFGAGDNGTAYRHDTEQACAHGHRVVGPDGLTLVLAEESASSESCHHDGSSGEPSCWSENASRRHATLSWAHGPLGSAPVVVPLP